MNKIATDDTNYLNLALLSALVGGGLYGGARGLKDLSREGAPPPAPTNELELTLPSTRMPQHQAGLPKLGSDADLPPVGQHLWENTKQYLLPTLTAGAGLYGGFKGTSALYDMYANHNIDSEKEKIKQEYLRSLQIANQKVGSVQTPLIDKFLLGYIDKIAEEQQGLGDWAGQKVDSGMDWLKHKLYGVADHGAQAPITGMTGAGLGLLGLGAAGSTFYIANRMDQNREENKQKTTLPTEIRLNVQ